MRPLNRVSIAHLPTPVESMERLSRVLGGPTLIVKRDDQTGLAFGGNKARKLEFLVAEALAMGAKTLVTTGGLQSNHCRQTAAAAAKFGLACVLVLAGDSKARPSANYLLDHLLGVEILWTDWENRFQALQEAYDQAKDRGKKPYLVPYGGSSPVGAAGYAYAVQELLAQKVEADWIVFPSSSGGTQAGLVAGARIFGYTGKILGISVDEPEGLLCQKVANLASEVTRLLDKPSSFGPDDILVNAQYCDAGYGVVTKNEIEAIRMFARHEGLLVDPVYTGRAAGGLIDLIGEGFFSPEETVLFWHTGGTPALFADQYKEVIHRI